LYSLTFRLYQTAAGGSALWQETRILQTTRGVLATNLGEATPLDLPFDRQYWLGIQIAGDPELSPRMAISASAYSLHTKKADTAAYALAVPQQAFVDSARIAGTVPNNSVSTSKIQDGAVTPAKINSSGASSGQVIMYNGSNVGWGNPGGGGGLNLPYSGSGSAGGSGQAALSISNSATSGSNYGIAGYSASSAGIGIYGEGNYGLYGNSSSIIGAGVYGLSTAAGGIGVQGSSQSSDGGGVYGQGGAYGVSGTSASTTGTGIRGWATALNGLTYGVSGHSASTSGTGVYGVATSSTGYTRGVFGFSSSADGVGVLGSVTGDGLKYGVLGENNSTTFAAAGVRGYAYGSGQVIGVEGVSPNGSLGAGIVGRGSAVGGYFETSNANYFGVHAVNWSDNGTGVFGHAAASTGYGTGVWGTTNANSSLACGLYGEAALISGSAKGVFGLTRGQGYQSAGVYGRAAVGTGYNGTGVWGSSDSGYAVLASGDFGATGGKYFHIDHPLDPSNRFLNHACTEGPEPLNVYSGNIILDAHGEAWVSLPSYFQEINRDLRYQLTPIGAPSNLYVAEEIQNNRFKIAGGKAQLKVSWRVEAVRNDPYIRAHARPVEEDKPVALRGKFVHPELYGQPKERGIFFVDEEGDHRLPDELDWHKPNK
jgi:hypothetical protein